jgi:hypothetical protein
MDTKYDLNKTFDNIVKETILENEYKSQNLKNNNNWFERFFARCKTVIGISRNSFWLDGICEFVISRATGVSRNNKRFTEFLDFCGIVRSQCISYIRQNNQIPPNLLLRLKFEQLGVAHDLGMQAEASSLIEEISTIIKISPPTYHTKYYMLYFSRVAMISQKLKSSIYPTIALMKLLSAVVTQHNTVNDRDKSFLAYITILETLAMTQLNTTKSSKSEENYQHWSIIQTTRYLLDDTKKLRSLHSAEKSNNVSHWKRLSDEVLSKKIIHLLPLEIITMYEKLENSHFMSFDSLNQILNDLKKLKVLAPGLLIIPTSFPILIIHTKLISFVKVLGYLLSTIAKDLFYH